MITTVLFDFFGTVVRPVDWPETPAGVLARRGYALDEVVRRRWITDALEGVEHTAASIDRPTYVAWERRRLSLAARASGVATADIDGVVDEMFAARAPRVLEPYPECLEGLAVLRDQGFRLGLCSNWDWDLAERVDACGLGGAFDVVISSAHAGSRKPRPGIYAYALEQCGADAAEVLFVGDTVGADVAGPMAAGMQAVFMARAEPAAWIGVGGDLPMAEAPPLPAGAAVVRDLLDVASLLAGDRCQ
jgi:putative hydrolase of the HAD superfamily